MYNLYIYIYIYINTNRDTAIQSVQRGAKYKKQHVIVRRINARYRRGEQPQLAYRLTRQRTERYKTQPWNTYWTCRQGCVKEWRLVYTKVRICVYIHT